MRSEEGYSIVELLVVMAVLGIVIGGVAAIFTSGLNASADQTRRYRQQEDARLALDRLRKDVRRSCTVSTSATPNTWQTSVTLYSSSDSCASGSHTVSWCLTGSGSRYGLYRIAAATCAGATQRFADYLTSSSVFLYTPPNSHITSLGGGLAGVATQDGGYALPRLHVDIKVNRDTTKTAGAYRVVDDIVLRNAPRSCPVGATC